MESVAVIVLNWNHPDLTCQTISSLAKISHRYFSFRLIIVDNGSTDNSVAIIKKHLNSLKIKNCKLKISPSNLGYVGGNNLGIKYALKHNFDYILLINNDVVVKPDFLDQLIKFSKNNPQYSIISPKIYFAPGHEYHHQRYQKQDLGQVIWSVGGQIDWDNIFGSNIGIDQVDSGQFDQSNEDIDFVSGCCLLSASSVFRQVGLLDNKYFMYLEDADFCQRAKRLGLKLVYFPKSVIWHLNAGSSNAGGPLHQYFLTRNRLIFGFKYAKLRTKIALFRQSINKLFHPFSSWERQGIIDFYLHRYGQGSWH